MQFNIGSTERAIRLVLGLVLIVLPFVFGVGTFWSWAAIIVGVVLILTGLLRFCSAWRLFGINTRGRK